MPTIKDILARAVQLHQAGKLGDAEPLYRQVLDADPNHAQALENLGVLAIQTDRPDDAIALLRRAAALAPAAPNLRGNLAAAYLAARDLPAAVAEYRQAVRLNPASAPFHVSLGQALVDLGVVDEALALALEALRLQPGFPLAYVLLGVLASQGAYTLTDADIHAMQALLAGGQLTVEHAAQLHFTLAGWGERLGRYDDAFGHYRQANDLKREFYRQAQHTFSRDAHRAAIDTLISTCTPEFFQQARGFGVPSDRPVFVVGMVRSGTSLVEQILASHPQVFGCGELKDIERMAGAFYPACAAGVDVATVRQLADRYLQVLAARGGTAAVRVIDKMPHNFLHLGMIAVLFPSARVIHCRRDPLDVCVSAYVQNFKDVYYASSLEDLGFFHRQYERLMAHWRRVLPMPMHDVSYEELVADQERVSRAMVAFCGLPWDERCLAFHQNPRAVHTASRLQVRQPIYKHAVARWQRFAAHLQPLHDALAD